MLKICRDEHYLWSKSWTRAGLLPIGLPYHHGLSLVLVDGFLLVSKPEWVRNFKMRWQNTKTWNERKILTFSWLQKTAFKFCQNMLKNFFPLQLFITTHVHGEEAISKDDIKYSNRPRGGGGGYKVLKMETFRTLQNFSTQSQIFVLSRNIETQISKILTTKIFFKIYSILTVQYLLTWTNRWKRRKWDSGGKAAWQGL
jgi:hypothetical protein